MRRKEGIHLAAPWRVLLQPGATAGPTSRSCLQEPRLTPDELESSRDWLAARGRTLSLDVTIARDTDREHARERKRRQRQRDAIRAPVALCGARTRAGAWCRLPAGHGTPTPGIGRCSRHGGCTPTHRAAAAHVEVLVETGPTKLHLIDPGDAFEAALAIAAQRLERGFADTTLSRSMSATRPLYGSRVGARRQSGRRRAADLRGRPLLHGHWSLGSRCPASCHGSRPCHASGERVMSAAASMLTSRSMLTRRTVRCPARQQYRWLRLLLFGPWTPMPFSRSCLTRRR